MHKGLSAQQDLLTGVMGSGGAQRTSVGFRFLWSGGTQSIPSATIWFTTESYVSMGFSRAEGRRRLGFTTSMEFSAEAAVLVYSYS